MEHVPCDICGDLTPKDQLITGVWMNSAICPFCVQEQYNEHFEEDDTRPSEPFAKHEFDTPW